MAKRRRKIKRSPPPWKSAIGFSIGVHAVIIFCIVGVGWRYLHQEKPGLPILIHEVIVGDGESTGGAPTSRPSTPHIAVTRTTMTSSESSQTRPDNTPQVATRSSDGTATHTIGESNAGTGNGTGSASGNGSGSGSGGGNGNPTLAEIRRRIESAKRYPAQARAMHQEGRVGVHFRIQPNGQIAEVYVAQSSGVPALDDAAMQAVTRSAPLPYYAGAIEFPLNFHLK